MNTTAEKKWIDDFILELRLREVRGDVIGDAVASVKELLADTGQSPDQAFGTPRAYAEQLELPLIENPGIAPATILAPGLSLIALLAYGSAIWAFFDGKTLGYSLPQLLLLTIPVIVVATLPLYVNWLLRNLWSLFLIFAITSASAIGAAALGPTEESTPWLQADPLTVCVVSGVILLAASAWGAVSMSRTGDDPIVDPRAAHRKPSKAIHALSSALPHALMPVFALGSTVVAWLMSR